LLSVATCADALAVHGINRGKPKDELLRGAALAHHEGKRARKGSKVTGFKEVARVVSA
jgi:topoisomerase IV subunit A